MLLNLLLLLCVLQSSFSDNSTSTCSVNFPSDFVFSAASSAYQFEGGWNEDGKGISVWDNYSLSHPDEPNGNVACDSYHKYKEDVALLKFLGVSRYKFSIAWTRILPEGFNTTISQIGLKYYKNLVTELKENGIEPFAVMYHNDLPQVLQDLGGLANRSFADWFSDYSRVLFTELGDEIKHWGTINEAQIQCWIGYGIGAMAPLVTGQQYLCGHNVIRAHAKVWHIYENEFKPTQNGNVAMTFASNWYYPASNETQDIEAAERVMQFTTGWFSNPIYHGDYPEVMKERIANLSRLQGLPESRLPEFTEEEKMLIKGTGSYFALQTYDAFAVSNAEEASADSPPSYDNDMRAVSVKYLGLERGASRMLDLLQWINDHCDNPTILITENGFGDTKYGLDDDNRILVIKAYLSKIREAIENGSKIIEYTVWALMDNYNWAEGYETKYGVFQVDFSSPNRTRTARKSAQFYKDLVHNRCF